jgi:hypothetical protein
VRLVVDRQAPSFLRIHAVSLRYRQRSANALESRPKGADWQLAVGHS